VVLSPCPSPAIDPHTTQPAQLTPHATHSPKPNHHTTLNHNHNHNHNKQVSSFFPDELYQGYISGLPGGRWFTLQLPFRDMTLTRLGRMSYVQRDLDGAFALESIGEEDD
jgi:hypothetical protein